MNNMQSCPYKAGDLLKFTPSERTISSYQDITLFGLVPGCVYQLREVKDNLYLYFDEGGGLPFGEFRRASIDDIKAGNVVLDEEYRLREKRQEERKRNFFMHKNKERTAIS